MVVDTAAMRGWIVGRISEDDFGVGGTIRSCWHVCSIARSVTRWVCVAGSGDARMEDCAADQGTTPYDQDVINSRLAKLGPDP